MSHELPLPETSCATLAHAVSGEHVLWTVMMLIFVLDVLTTLYGFGRGLAEPNPVVLAFIPAFGPVGVLISPKLVVLAVMIVTQRVLPSRYHGAIPIGVAVPWGVAELVNIQLILVTVLGWAARASR